MLAARLLQLARGSGVTRDERSVMEVLDAAADRTGKPREPRVASTLRDQGVDWAWQLQQLSEEDWDRLGATLGLKTAAKAELIDPPKPTANSTEAALDNDRIRQFLLLPGADGTEAKPLGEVSAMMFGLLVTPIADRQMLLLTLCEVLALVSGLFLPLTFEVRRHAPGEPSAAKGWPWDVPPTLSDGMDAMAMFVFMTNALVTYLAIGMAMCIAAGGWHADDRFCRSAMGILMMLLMIFFFGVFWPIYVLTVWKLATDSASPYPLIGCLVLGQLVAMVPGSMLARFCVEEMALEVYHMPPFWKNYVKLTMWSVPWIKRLLRDEVLKLNAERRAAILRAQSGFTASAIKIRC